LIELLLNAARAGEWRVVGMMWDLREERGLAQRELSEPGISYAYISRIEAGARNPSENALRMLATKLGVTPLYLETGSDEGVCPHCGRRAVAVQPRNDSPDVFTSSTKNVSRS
jgi:transcriptional regulator with XRE-family HTH domain